MECESQIKDCDNQAKWTCRLIHYHEGFFSLNLCDECKARYEADSLDWDVSFRNAVEVKQP